MSKLFISSTYEDLADHRKALIEIFARMKCHFSAMEFFGSRTDAAVPLCQAEIDSCSLFLGVYAWRYGWIPPGSKTSVTEQEFDYARQAGKPCLSYLIDERYPWPPVDMDMGERAEALKIFKEKVSQRVVRATFTTPDNLAKQVAADVARELSPSLSTETVGGLLQLNWDYLSPDLQRVILDAYLRAKQGSSAGVVSTRHVIAALEALPNSASPLFHAMPSAIIEEIRAASNPASPTDETVALAQLFSHKKPFSQCVLGSLQRLLPSHSPSQRLLAIEVAADILKNGHDESVQKFRRAGIDGTAVRRLMRHATHVASNRSLIYRALETFDEAQLRLLAYELGWVGEIGLSGEALREKVLKEAEKQNKVPILAGEIMRRNPDLLH